MILASAFVRVETLAEMHSNVSAHDPNGTHVRTHPTGLQWRIYMLNHSSSMYAHNINLRPARIGMAAQNTLEAQRKQTSDDHLWEVGSNCSTAVNSSVRTVALAVTAHISKSLNIVLS